MNNQEIINGAVALAEQWQTRANELLTSEEKHIQKQMKRLLTNPHDKILMTRLIDQSFRSHDPDRISDQIGYLLEKEGVPEFLNRMERLLMQIFKGFGKHFATFAVPKLIDQMRSQSSRAIIPGEEKQLHKHLQKRRKQGIRMNINHLGEAVLGEEEADRRRRTYIEDMKNPNVEYISIKISTIYSQISSLAFEDTVATLRERLTEIYRVAKENYYTREDGTRVQKFVNLDMEEYRDLQITYEAFISTLDQEEFRGYSAGIVLQAYLPDSHPLQIKLTEWAKARVAAGCAPVKLRIVKGANLEMEKVEASLFNWPLAPYDNKLEVDANYKRMVAYGMKPENIKAVNLGIGSHNLFELAYAAKVAEAKNLTPYFYFEMLEGMADHVRRAIAENSSDILLYAPVASKDEFINAIAYLIRRLDENTSPENFLRYSPDLRVDSSEWTFLRQTFIDSCAIMEKAQDFPNRIQDRSVEQFPESVSSYHTNGFVNEPDTDWSMPGNRKWAEGIRHKWYRKKDSQPIEIPFVVGGTENYAERDIREVFDPNQSKGNVCLARCTMANSDDIARAIAIAKADPDGWRHLNARQRHKAISAVAIELRKSRGDLIGAAAANTGKVFTETDVEISEAIDFAELYPLAARKYEEIGTLEARGKGVGLVLSPWNFPVAIPCGGIITALAAGNPVIFKPASDAIVTAWELCKCFWRAGISRNTLQFVPCSGSEIGPRLTTSPDVDFIILTGGTETGLEILQQTPGVYLAAETGGKNATIVTDMADRDQAIKNVVYSAFGNSGQKCSATSLLILEKTIYDDPHFKQQLVDAAKSLKTGSAWNFGNKLGTLIKPPHGDLQRGLSELEAHEEWVLKSEMVDGNSYLWTPGIKYGVQPGSYTHMTEFFGPMLGVMRAENLDHAIELVNMTGYGLTSAIESLDEREQEIWKERIFAGNLYINRGSTGAITLRQPFGGKGKSALGPGIKAGCFEYVSQFMDFTETGLPEVGTIQQECRMLELAEEWRRLILWSKLSEYCEDIRRVVSAIHSYLYWFEQVFSREIDFFHLRGQDNLLRFSPIENLVIRLDEQDSLFDTLARIAAASISGCTYRVSVPPDMDNDSTTFLASRYGKQLLQGVELYRQDDAQLISALPNTGRLRYGGPGRVPEAVFAATSRTGLYISRTPVYMEGRLELLQYFQQQSVCNNYHRYGNLGDRSLD